MAIIAAIPASIAAYASLKNKSKSDKQLTPSNGHTLIHMIEDIWEEITEARLHRERLEDEDETLRGELYTHDERLQGMERKMEKHWPAEEE